MKFNKGTTWYAVNASENSVTASAEVTNTSFEVMELWTPNKPYVVLRSNKMSGNEYLYLSSNGAGNMQLKVWNKPVPGPPNTTSEADPALLFRVVRPFGQD
ncbi:Hypothetical predicted protein [Paramuricea clavata]|uniref:Uncharacterized protein n=1 Tax=Paramuricea clavata TaxID=317549 RepID=A0A7D9L3J8_PARCT|nr:Hypothetical predicted protein [Paramuricea clavata]